MLGLAGVATAVAIYALVSFLQILWQRDAIARNADEIFRSPTSFVAGNPDGDVSVVAFFDYNCPYCREGAPDLAKLVAADGKVRLVLKELPAFQHQPAFKNGLGRRHWLSYSQQHCRVAVVSPARAEQRMVALRSVEQVAL